MRRRQGRPRTCCAKKAQQFLHELSQLVGYEKLERSNCAIYGAIACELIQASVGCIGPGLGTGQIKMATYGMAWHDMT
jgi:hypothetical protein